MRQEKLALEIVTDLHAIDTAFLVDLSSTIHRYDHLHRPRMLIRDFFRIIANRTWEPCTDPSTYQQLAREAAQLRHNHLKAYSALQEALLDHVNGDGIGYKCLFEAIESFVASIRTRPIAGGSRRRMQ